MSAEIQSDHSVAIDVSEVPDEDNAGPPAGSGMQITFRSLVYQVRNKQNKKKQITILHGLSGFFNPSQMTAVMGPRQAYHIMLKQRVINTTVWSRDMLDACLAFLGCNQMCLGSVLSSVPYCVCASWFWLLAWPLMAKTYCSAL